MEPSADPREKKESVEEATTDEGRGEGAGEDEVPKECPLCTYMREGPCGDEFSAFDEMCVKTDDREAVMDECVELMSAMSACFEKNREYYGPVLDMLNEDDDQDASQDTSQDQSSKEGDADTKGSKKD